MGRGKTRGEIMVNEAWDVNLVALLYSPVSPAGLFGSAVDGFTLRFTEVIAVNAALSPEESPFADAGRLKSQTQQQRPKAVHTPVQPRAELISSTPFPITMGVFQ
ncbi:hypothetical protein E1301_Tti000709 [Triplophysa tibetana]|uniref:Uncharacterized protein n=1 Tax=Triplophysa tibetana TaxID=1572043 RepID=A0A5A9N7M5_9TELE|nr:hypothetical protein E1301_Tti000709 [Triplophysa tibetana]